MSRKPRSVTGSLLAAAVLCLGFVLSAFFAFIFLIQGEVGVAFLSLAAGAVAFIIAVSLIASCGHDKPDSDGSSTPVPIGGFNAGMEEPKQLSDSDCEAISRAVEALPGVDHRIVRMLVREPGRVHVHTGMQVGPRCGHGDTLEARQTDTGEWSVRKISSWIS